MTRIPSRFLRFLGAFMVLVGLVFAAPVVEQVVPNLDTPAYAAGDSKHGGPWEDDTGNGVPNFLDGENEALSDTWGFSPAMQWVWHLMNLLILVGGLVFLARKGIKAALKDRSTAVQKELDESAEVQAEAQGRYEELEQRLAGFEDEVATMKSEAAKAIEAEKAAALQRARETADRIRQSAERTILDEQHKATKVLRAEAVQLAVELAERTLTAELSEDDRKRLASDFLQTIRAEAPSGGPHG
ncbi:MAG: hypothetical protein EA397_12600 [Deltaproteobacteria bacterium]|nr:MAG: hypothetical protein EA397_12600 [Deltaproteobacteria bacterium]